MRTILLILSIIFLTNGQVFGQQLRQQQKRYIQRNAQIISKEERMLKTNWKKVLKGTKNKQIVLLGEFNHGSKEVFLLRNELIKALHEKQQFDIILFESGIGELFFADLNKEQLSPREMTRNLFGVWQTKAFRQLMDYIKTEKMTVAGFDAQRTGRTFHQLLQIEAQKTLVDTILYNNLEERYTIAQNSLRNRKTIYTDKIKAATTELINDYQLVYQALANIFRPTKSTFFALQTLNNRMHSLQYRLQFLRDKDYNKRWIARDSMMAENVQWLAENIFQDQKLIIIGHNFHIAKHNEKEEVMGEFLSEKYSEKMYSIGIFAAEGSYANNAGKAKAMLPADSENLDIKHFIKKINGYASFLPIPTQQRKIGSQWLFKEIVVNDTFIDLSSSHTLNLAKHFDGLILLQKVSLPDK